MGRFARKVRSAADRRRAAPDASFGSFGVNAYDCRDCGRTTWVRHATRGVTPGLIVCREGGSDCNGMAVSRWYRVPSDHPEPTHEWYRPERAWVEREERKHPGSLDHYLNSGLRLRPISTEREETSDE